MIGVIISEVMDWSRNCGRRTLLTFISILVVAGTLSMLRPELWLEVFTGALIWVGLSVGTSKWTEIKPQDWIAKINMTTSQVIIAKVISVLLIGGVHCVAVLPVVIIMSLLWGIPFPHLAAVLLVSLIGMGTAAILSFITLHFQIEEKEFLVFLMVGGWLGITSIFTNLRILNPFYQVWEITANGLFQWLGWLGSLGLALLLFLLEQVLLRREVIGNAENG